MICWRPAGSKNGFYFRRSRVSDRTRFVITMASIPRLRFCARRLLAAMFLGAPMVAVAATAEAEALFFQRVLPLRQ